MATASVYENASRASYIDLDLHQGHTDLYLENNILETGQAMPIKFAVKTVRLKV